MDHNIKGQGIYAYVVLAEGTKPSAELKKKLNDVVRNQIGSFAVPETIHWAPGDHQNVIVMQQWYIRRHRQIWQIPCHHDEAQLQTHPSQKCCV